MRDQMRPEVPAACLRAGVGEVPGYTPPPCLTERFHQEQRRLPPAQRSATCPDRCHCPRCVHCVA